MKIKGNYMINTLEGKEDDCIGIQAEVSLYYTLSDAHDLIKTIGLKQFLESLYHEKQGRLLTIEEYEAMQVLHDNWDL
jgi:hypothetical protein